MKNILVKKNPFPDEVCERKKCVLCNTDSKNFRIPCSTNGVGYRLICETCEARGLLKVYEGETARSARTRGAEHLSQFKNERGDSALHKHRVSDHEGEEIKLVRAALCRRSDYSTCHYFSLSLLLLLTPLLFYQKEGS